MVSVSMLNKYIGNVTMLEVVKDEDGAQYSSRSSAFKYRDRISIIADILSSLIRNPQGKRKSNIMQSAGLNSPMINKYLDLLLLNGLVKVEDECIYKPTAKGLKFLQDFNMEYQGVTNYYVGAQTKCSQRACATSR